MSLLQRHMNIDCRLTILLVAVCTSIVSYGQSHFVSKKMQDTYNALPIQIKNKVIAKPQDQSIIYIPTIAQKAQIVLERNKYMNICHLGICLPKHNIADSLQSVHKFMENFILNALLIENNKDVKNLINHYSIEAFEDNIVVDILSNVGLQKLAKAFLKAKHIDIVQYKDRFYVKAKTDDKKNFVVTLPTNINLISGMNKEELETSFLKDILCPMPNHIWNAIIDSMLLHKPQQLDTNVLLNAHFDMGFKRDTYFKNNEVIFSEAFPEASFANLFTYQSKRKVSVSATFMLYGYKQITKALDLTTFLYYLHKNCVPYVGISKSNTTHLEATILYYNTMFNYVHMIIAKAKKEMLFQHNTPQIETCVYLYIPQGDSIRKIIKDK